MFKPELVLPPLLTAAVLVGVILYSMRRAIRESNRLSLELTAKAQARVDALLVKHQAEVARIEAERAARAAAEAAGFDLVLTLDAGADADEVFDRVADHIRTLSGYAEAGGGAGMRLDLARSRAEPGLVSLRLIPTDPRYAAGQREVVAAQTRKFVGVSGVELVTARSHKLPGVSAVEFAAA